MGKRSREKRERRIDAPLHPAPTTARAHRRAAVAEPVAPAAPPSPWADIWREHGRAATILFGVALAIRGLLLVQIARTPYLEVANIDSDSYQTWATQIVEGAWLPTRTFYQSPFYAYFLAVLYKVFGIGPWIPRLVQILLGSVSPVLVYAIGARLFSRRVAWIAGLGLALYGPVMLEEVTLNKTSILITTVLAGVVLFLRNGPTARLGGMAWAGFWIGLTVVGIAQWLPAFVLLTAYAWYFPDGVPSDRRAGAAAAFLLGGLVTVLPVVWWNTAHGGGLVLTSGGAGLNLYSGNNPRASALPASPRGLRDVPQFEEDDARRLAERAVGRPLLPAEVSQYWSHEAMTFITGQPAAYLALLQKKFVALWNAYEIADNYHYAFMRAHFLPLLYATVTFAVVAPLALVGLFTPFWRRKDVTALYVVCLGYLVTPLLFYVRGRYRLPAVPFLLVFAALAVERVRAAIERADWPRVGALAAGLAVAGVFVNQRYCEAAHDGMPSVCLSGDTWFDQEWLKLTEWYEAKGDVDRALAYAERARECSAPRSAGQIPFWIASLESKKVQALAADGRKDDATPHFTRAEALYKSLVPIKYRLGTAYGNLGQLYLTMDMPAKAAEALEAGAATGAMEQAGFTRLGRAYVTLGRCADAERTLTKLDRDRGFTSPSDDTQTLLATCHPK